MTGKFVLFFLVALCATQGFQAKTIENRGLIEDAINGVKGIINKLQEGVKDLVTSIPNLINNLDKEIKKITDKIIEDTMKIIRKMNDSVEAILALAGIDVAGAKICIDAEKKKVENLIKETTDAVEACRKNADDRTAELREEMEKLKTKALDTIKEVNSGVINCIKEHPLNPIKHLKCMIKHLADVKVKSDALLVQIKDTIFIANKTAADVTITLFKCTTKINANVLAGQKNILDNFKQCVKDKNTQ